ncbi:molybdopterin molybdochelatase [Pseudorhodobacter antarcticus]|uniref:Molybdopterin molybdenumtransferase n=1 Tax=Pseudorhodobacter antarcticus TaxID=1077947 RepID=A0A1H8DJY5_9RHOB|nr:gephyrin-like molybdotransferase Glp [Pseudorhodobacter antarcticus]SEN07641.1 molybdopterin molybdochelatase [Pseudorhodobacter antarcticus]
MISVDAALALALALVRPLGTEILPLARAANRFMPHPATAARDQPPFAVAAMDGYATVGPAHPGAQFVVVGEAAAGHAWHGTLHPGQALRIFTGAPVPPGADRVVIQEDVTRSGDQITLTDAFSGGPHIRPKGQDFKAGDTLSARLLRPADLALLASMNVANVSVTRRPIVAIIATGDELVMPGEVPRDDQIIASNSFALQALAKNAGAIARLLPIARDDEASLRAVFDLAAGADLIVTIGGASVGDHDMVGKVAADLGMDRAFYKIAMRPGKPLMAGKINGTAMLGLPGNPVSSIVCGHIFMLPMIRAMLGDPTPAPVLQPARLTAPLPANGPRAHYMRAQVKQGTDGPLITGFDRQDSALLTVLADANALLVRPVDDPPRNTGDLVGYLPI